VSHEAAERVQGGLDHQLVAAGRNEHRIHHELLQLVLLHRGHDHIDGGCGRDHAGLQRLGSQVVQHHGQLAPDEIRLHREDAIHSRGVLGGERGDHGAAVDIEAGERLQVGLDPGPAGGVGSRHSQRFEYTGFDQDGPEGPMGIDEVFDLAFGVHGSSSGWRSEPMIRYVRPIGKGIAPRPPSAPVSPRPDTS